MTSKFRQWDVKLINTLTHLKRGYGWAMEVINECPDKGGDPGEELLLDKMSGTLATANGDHSVDVVELNSDLEFIMLDKAQVGSDILHRMNNANPRGGIHLYAEVYNCFSESSGLGLAEHTGCLMNPPQVKKEDDVAEAIEIWEEKLKRLARHGDGYQLTTVFKQ